MSETPKKPEEQAEAAAAPAAAGQETPVFPEPEKIPADKLVEIELIEPSQAVTPEVMKPVASAFKTLCKYAASLDAKGIQGSGWGYTLKVRKKK
ncbi:hypothetical protein [Acanthopleuribacter pedis]|uniref:Uncharacterized protein n=1 Tax=Acanthopleuribacter pedis TaxID=442870 RepID=A0A8J7QKI9_9BACT|nr:hypothetical protein [Acanthopleuribacter pedis]MBO1321635.1 hypothetical protein [Acanthopleuribacter pedis]